MNSFCFTLRDAILEWGENFMQFHPSCSFMELEVTFCKHYHTIQNDEQIDMALRVIKQSNDKKVKAYYERILKIANYFQHEVNDNLLTTFFRVRLVPYLQIAITGMKQDTLFKHKEFVVTYEETMANAKEC
jgi:hypothetical protein